MAWMACNSFLIAKVEENEDGCHFTSSWSLQSIPFYILDVIIPKGNAVKVYTASDQSIISRQRNWYQEKKQTRTNKNKPTKKQEQNQTNQPTNQPNSNIL